MSLIPSATEVDLPPHPIKVLLVDDQRIVGETIRRMLRDIAGLEFLFCADPLTALSQAEAFLPTVILQDLIMPGADGIEMVRAFRKHPATASTPIIVLSSKEEAKTKAEAFAGGANDYLVKLPDALELVARIRYHSAAYISRLERDEAFAALKAQQRILAQDIADAAAYVESLLPAPMPSTSAVGSDWRFIPSSSLGGDSFGYHWLTPECLCLYLLDVCGHGVGSALLSVSAIDTVRNGTLPGTDFTAPAQVLAGLNRAFPMAERDGKYFTMWYGIFNVKTRELTHAAAGHPPAVAVAPDGSVIHLGSTGVMVGIFPDSPYAQVTTYLAPGTQLFVYSDGCYEVFNPEGEMMSLAEFSALLAQAAFAPVAVEQVLEASRAWQAKAEFDDDFSLLHFRL